jgi:hypothetical protein
MAALPNSLPDGDGLKSEARPVSNECGEPTVLTQGPVPYRAIGPIPIESTIDGGLYLAAEIWAEGWPAGFHPAWLLLTIRGYAPRGNAWRNDATGWSFDE